MTGTKSFPSTWVLSVVTGRLISDNDNDNGIGGVYQVLNWMTDEDLFTHQLPRVCQEAAPHIINIHPHLQKAIDEDDQVSADNWRHWRDVWLDRYGPEITVPKLTKDQHERIDPMSELSEKVHPSKIIPVYIKGKKSQ